MTFDEWYKTKEKHLENLCWEIGGGVYPPDFKALMKEAWDARYATLTYNDI